MTLQDDFFDYIKESVSRHHLFWNKRPTQKWYNFYALIDGRERVIIWVRKPDMDGTFWVWISIPFEKISEINDLVGDNYPIDSRKFYISLQNVSMFPIELLDRRLTASSFWEETWPVGFKIIESNQFELATKIIIEQWR